MKIAKEKTGARLVLLFIATALVVLVLATSAWFVYRNMDEATGRVLHVQSVLHMISSIRADSLQIELYSQRYLLTADNKSLDSRNTAISRRETRMSELAQLIINSVIQQQYWTELRQLADERLTMMRTIQTLSATEGIQAARSYATGAPLEETRADLMIILDKMEQEENQQYKQFNTFAQLARRFMVVAEILFVVILLSLIWVSLIIISRQLKVSQRNIRLIVDGAKDYAIILLDPVGNVMDWNEGARRLGGYVAEEIIGQSFTRFYPPEDVAAGKPAHLLAQAEQEDRCVDQSWRVRKDGTCFFADVTISAIRAENGALLGFSNVTRDITEQKAAESRIALDYEQQNKLHELLVLCLKNDALDSMLQSFLDCLLQTSWLHQIPNAGIFLIDPEKQALGLVAKHLLDPSIVTDCTCVKIDQNYVPSHAGMADHSHYILPLLANGIQLGVLMLCLPTEFHRNLAMDQFMASVADILASVISRKQSELALEAHQANLEQMVLLRTAELEQARNEAERLSRVKDTFLATMSHEIRTPMNALLGMLELLTLHPLDAEQTRLLGVAQQAGKTLLRIIDDILDFSKIEAGKLMIQPEPTSITELVELTAAFFMPVASSQGLLLVYTIDPHISPAVMADRLRLRQILNNLVSNAIKFTEHGQVEIKAQLMNSRLGMNRVCLSVTDTGLGIDKDTQTRLFQPFSQASAETTRRYGGSGLGLAICRRLAELMQGNLELVSAPGHGSTFSLTLELPVIDAELLRISQQAGKSVAQPERQTPPSPETALTTGQLVLLVDDHATNRDVLETQLRLLGYASHQASTSGDALRMWKATRYGLLITDCHMPDMDGYQLASEIRRQEQESGRPHMPILAWTANAMREAAEECVAAGMDDILVKPADLQTLKAKLQALLPLPHAPNISVAASGTDEAMHIRTDVLDTKVLRELSGGDRAIEIRLLQRFSATNELDIEALAKAITAHDASATRQLAHRIKGAARTVGARDYATACEALEQAAKNTDWPGITSSWEHVMLSRSALETVISKET